MASNDEMIRLACMEISLSMTNNPRGDPAGRAAAFESWVAGSDVRLRCLRLSAKMHVNIARAGADFLLSKADEYLSFVSRAPVEIEPVKRKRGRPKKS